jgi:predicted DNA-binding transcriptional regulator YafY
MIIVLIAQFTILRIFRLIRLLSRKPFLSSRQLAQRLEISLRSVQRYLELLREVGYTIEKNEHGQYFIVDPVKTNALFGVEENLLLKDLLDRAYPDHPLTESILKKLYIHSELLPLSQSLFKIQAARIIEKLSTAIREQKQVLLKNYHSVNSNTLRNRQVEPIDFSENFSLLSAYEPASGKVKDFKVERIGEVEILYDLPATGKAAGLPDLFSMRGEKEFSVKLLLSGRAYRLLLEEYPLSKSMITKTDETLNDNKNYLFEGKMQQVEGIGRFVLGLCDEVEVIESEELKEYLRSKIKKTLWL